MIQPPAIHIALAFFVVSIFSAAALTYLALVKHRSRFRLRTLLILITLAALALGFVMHVVNYRNPPREFHRTVE